MFSIKTKKDRSDFTPIEEGKAYANYLKIDMASIGCQLPSNKYPDLKVLSKQIGVGENVISRRVSLLVLPEDVSTTTLDETKEKNESKTQ